MIVKLVHRETKMQIKKGDTIVNNQGVNFKFIKVKDNGLIDVEGDTDLHPVSFSQTYAEMRG